MSNSENVIVSTARPSAQDKPSRTWQIHFWQGELVKAAIELEQTGSRKARQSLRTATQEVIKLKGL